VNGEDERESEHDNLMIENADITSPSIQQDEKPSVDGIEDVDGNSFSKTDASSLPSIKITQRVYGDNDMNGAYDDDDIYNFELTEDQKQASQELDNLKLDLHFAEG